MLKIDNLEKTYGNQKIVSDFSLSIKAPLFGFLGQNGAGKTTIMKMIVGLLRPDSGTILIDGVSAFDYKIREKISFMPETPYFYDRLTGLEFLRFCGQLFSSSRNKKIKDYEAILKQMGIYDARHHAIREYSKGMRQRLGFAQALVNDPEYLFLDEPLDGLDPVGRKEIKELMVSLKKDGKKIFFNTHILYDVEELCDEMAIVDRGHLLYDGSVEKFCSGNSLEEQFVKTVSDRNEVEKT